jgi:hypothetical protein
MRVNISRCVRWAERVARVRRREMHTERKRPFGELRIMYENDTKIDVKEMR